MVLRDEVDAFDRWVDKHVEPWRGRRLPDALAYGASMVGDGGAAWLVLGIARGWRPGPRRARAAWAVLFTGAVTPVVNGTLKTAVQRVRPLRHERPHVPVRVPRSASFPSGHALAAWCAATLLARGDPLAPAFYGLAAAVSFSRVHVRLHHASDVVAGAILGITLGHLGRHLGRHLLPAVEP